MLADQINGGFEQGGNDLLALAGAVALFKCGEDADHTEHAARDIDHARARAQRLARRPGHIGETSHHLRDLVKRGAIFVGAGEEAFLAGIY